MLLMCACTVIFFLGGWLKPAVLFSNFKITLITGAIWFNIKMIFLIFLYVWIRAALPRYRYDQLMNLGWKVFFPISLSYLLLIFFDFI